MKLWPLCILGLILQGCGAENGDGLSNKAVFKVSQNEFYFSAASGHQAPEAQATQLTFSNFSGPIWITTNLAEDALIESPTLTTDNNVYSLHFQAIRPQLALGIHQQEFSLLACTDPDCIKQLDGSPRTISITYEILPNPNNVDRDQDGIPDSVDMFPDDPTEDMDSDGDGIGDHADPDDDNDGINDLEDDFPFNPNEWFDTDGDSRGDNTDLDDDNDGHLDVDDAFPLDASEWLDTDGDGVGNNTDHDDDNDGYDDIVDAFPLDPTEWLDTDGDGWGNTIDDDDDNDGYQDSFDAFPFDASEWLDTDGDGIGNNQDEDDDNDGHADTQDDLPLDPNEWLDTDGDGVGNIQDDNDDNDFYLDVDDIFPTNPNSPAHLIAATPETLRENTPTTIIVSGLQFGFEDTFYINDTQVVRRERFEHAVELAIPALSAGTHQLSVRYPNETFRSVINITVLADGYHQYAELSESGSKAKAIYSDKDEALYFLNRAQGQLSKYQFVQNEGWQYSALSMSAAESLVYDPHNSLLYGVHSDSLSKINRSTMQVIETIYIGRDFNSPYRDGVMDAMGGVVLVTGLLNDYSTSINRYGLQEHLPDFGVRHTVGYLNYSAISISTNGRYVLLGEATSSPAQPLISYQPLTATWTELAPRQVYASAQLGLNSRRVLLNHNRLYNANYTLLATLRSVTTLTNSVMSEDASIVIANDSQYLYYYDLNDIEDSEIIHRHSVALPEDLGSIHGLLMTRDNLNVIVIGQEKVLILPIWQIIEDRVGDSDACPTAGCGDIQVRDGVSLQ